MSLISNSSRIFAMTLLAFVAGNTTAMASGPVIDDNYPFIAPINCKEQIKEPNNSGGYYLSQGCGNILVRPPRLGSLSVGSFAFNSNVGLCDTFNQTRSNLSFYEEQIARVQASIRKLPADAAEVVRLTALIDTLQKQKAAAFTDQIFQLEGATMQMVFDLNSAQMVNDYLTTNKDLASHPTVSQAQLVQGFLSVDLKKQSAEYAKEIPAVIRSSVPGLATRQGDPASVIMNGALSGGVTLSLAGACPALGGRTVDRNTNLNDIPVSSKNLNAYLVGNYTYAIAVKSQFGFEAHLNVKTAVDMLVHASETKGQFSVEDARTVIMNGNDDSVFKLRVFGYEQPVSKDDPLYMNLRNQLYTEMTVDLIAKMVDAGILKIPAEPNAPAGGNVNTSEQIRVCYSTSFLGLFNVGGGCSTQTRLIPIWHNGYAGVSADITKNLTDDIHRETQVDNTIWRPGTSTFVFNEN